jgi:proliferating cell nuclear antigen
MHLKTIQASAIRSVFEVLKDIINDVNVYFGPDGITIRTLDNARVTLVHMHMSHENFEEYTCESEIVAGLNITNTYKLIKSMSNSDTLTIDIVDRDYMQFVIENVAKKTSTKYNLKLLDINEEWLTFPEVEMDVITTMPSIDFQRITRDMGNLSNDITICRDNAKFELSCIGDFANQTTVIDYPDGAARVSNVYSLKYINMFTKATGMCSSVQIMQNSVNEDMPIIFMYTIANLGYIKFYLAPKADN